MDELVQLVESIYVQNSDPEHIRLAQLRLQAIQRSDNGWEFANSLMTTGKPACQFFGALTFKVQINVLASARRIGNSTPDRAGSQDDEDDDFEPNNQLGTHEKIHDAIRQLLHWVLVLFQENQPRFVMTKMLSTVATIFIKLPTQWPDCLQSFCTVIASGDTSILYEPNTHEFYQILNHMTQAQLALVLQFGQTLIEDATSDVTPNSVAPSLFEMVSRNCNYIVQLAEYLLNSDVVQRDPELTVQLLDTLNAWICFSIHNKLDEMPLKRFSSTMVALLRSPNDDIMLKSIETVTSLVTSYPRFFSVQIKEDLFQYLLDAAQQYTSTDEALLSHDSQKFCELLLAFSETCFEEFFSSSEPSATKLAALLPFIASYSQVNAIPIVEDDMAMQVLEFWSSLVDEVISVSLGSTESVAQFVAQIIETYWTRIKLPPGPVLASWTLDTWREFNTFRNDVCDFLELSYAIVGVQLYELLVNSAVGGIAQLDSASVNDCEDTWNIIECSLFCLNGLSEIIGAESSDFDKIQSVFESSLWVKLNECTNLRVRQTAVNLIGSYDAFFERPTGQPYLVPTQKYLFDSLSVPALSLIASRSLQKLCQSSREYLTQLLPSFFEIYFSRSLYATLSTTAHERTCNALASVIQALASEDQKAEYISRLLETLTARMESFIQSSNPADVDIASVISLLKCVVAIGKGIRVPDDRKDLSVAYMESVRDYWATDPCGIKSRILQMIDVCAVQAAPYNQDTEVCDICCDIFKCGFSERLSNPFVFGYDVILKFVSSKYDHGPSSCWSSLVGLTSCMLTNISVSAVDEEQSLECVTSALKIFFSSSSSFTETDLQSGTMQLLHNVLTHFTAFFLTNNSLNSIMPFAIAMMDSSDRFVLRDSRIFWAAFVCLKPAQSLEPMYFSILDTYGPSLVSILVSKVSGDAARSELDQYTEVVRKLIFSHPLRCKPWFTASLLDSPNQSVAKQDLKSRNQFLAKLLTLRGSFQTKAVIKDFWLVCRGIADYV